MPIVANAQGKRFTFPDGTTQEQMGSAIDEFFAQQIPPPAAQAAPQTQQPTAQPEEKSFMDSNLSDLIKELDQALIKIPGAPEFTELASSINKSALGTLDALGTDTINTILTLGGSDLRSPSLVEKFGSEGPLEPGLKKDIISKAGEFVPLAAGVGAALRGIASGLPVMVKAGESTLAGVTRQLGATTPAQDVAGGILAGGGGAVGKDVGGVPGEVIGSVAAPVAGFTALNTVKGAINSLRGLSNAPPGAGIFGNESSTKAAVRKAIEENPTDNITAKYIINGAGKVKADPVAREVIKQGFDEGLVAAIKGSKPKDKQAMKNMITIIEKGKGNRLFFEKNRPTDVIGDTVLKRFSSVRDINKTAGKELDGVAKGLKGQKVDSSRAVGQFFDDLNEIGISVTRVGGALRAGFKGSDIEGIPAAENAVKKMLGRLNFNPERADAFNIHRMKKFIDEQVSFGKIGEGLTGKTERVIKSLRRNLDGSLDDAFPKYNEVNTRFSESRQALDEFQKAAGSNFDPFSANADKFVGNLSRRLLSNVQSRVKLMDSISQLENTSAKFGVKFNDDVFTQAMFADDLERVFGSFAPKSFKGEIEGAIKSAATDVRGGVLETGAKVVGKAAEKARGINEQNAIKSLKQLVGK